MTLHFAVQGPISGKEAKQLLFRRDRTINVCLFSQFLPDFEEDDLLSRICEKAKGTAGILMTRQDSSSAQKYCFGSMLPRPFTACELLQAI